MSRYDRVRSIAILAGLFIGASALAGCAIMQTNGSVTAAKVLRKTTRITEETDPKTGAIKKTTIQDEAEATGNGYTGMTPKDINTTAPHIDAPDFVASAGGVTFKGYDPTGVLKSVANMRTVYIITALGILLGVLAAWLLDKTLGGLIIAASVGFAGAVRFFEEYPWAPAIPLGLGLIAIVVVCIRLYRANKLQTSLVTVVKAVENVSDAAQAEVKSAVEKAAGKNLDPVKDTITKVKRDL